MSAVKAIADLVPGDMVDLEGDRYADPDRSDPAAPYEYALVAEVVIETAECSCVYFEGRNPVGFPPDHVLPWGGHNEGYAP